MEYLSVEQIEDILGENLYEDFPDEDPSKLTDIESDDEREQERNNFDQVFSSEICKELKKQRRYGNNENSLRAVLSESGLDQAIVELASDNITTGTPNGSVSSSPSTNNSVSSENVIHTSRPNDLHFENRPSTSKCVSTQQSVSCMPNVSTIEESETCVTRSDQIIDISNAILGLNNTKGAKNKPKVLTKKGVKSASKSKTGKKISKAEIERQRELKFRNWKTTEISTRQEEYTEPLPGPKDEFFGHCKTATDVFLVLVDELLDHIVTQSNLYATQKNPNKDLGLTKEWLMTFIGINFIMGYHKLPSWKDYWSSSRDLNVPVISEAMARNKFDDILSNLHLNDNSQVPEKNKYKAYKIRPMITALNNKFMKVYNGTRELSVDESMIAFKGRSSMKQYNPLKPIKRGYKLWCIADQRGYVLKFELYQGKAEEIENEFKDFSLGERVVLFLTKSFWGQGRICFFDNYFNSFNLLDRLKTERVLAAGTIRKDRKGIPPEILSGEEIKNRGDFDFRMNDQGGSIFIWMDSKNVFLASNFHGNEVTKVKRVVKKDGTRADVPCPTVVYDYNKGMGGVDLADRYRALYCVDRKSRKWWHRLFFGLLDVAFVNAYIIYCERFGKVSVLEFRRSVSLGLLTFSPNNRGTKRKGSNSPRPQNMSNKRKTTNFSVPKEVRQGNRGVHWPKFYESRGRCEVCSKNKIESRPYSKCDHCQVYLCCNDKKNCFYIFHHDQ